MSESEVVLGVYSDRESASPCNITDLEGLPSIHLFGNEPQNGIRYKHNWL